MMLVLKVLLIILLLCCASLLILIIIKGRGKPVKLIDEQGKVYPNGISVREKIRINDSDQYIFITGEDRDKPVLLFLHGGPGSPEIALHKFEVGKRLEEQFVVCYWEQRGAGLSYGAKLSSEKMTLDVMLADTLAMTEYLRTRFKQNKVYLMGHSWGSFLGIKAIQAKPGYYQAYFGIGQVADQTRSEKLAYDYMIQHATEIGDTKALKALEQFDSQDPAFPTPKYLMTARTAYMNKYAIGIMHQANFKMSTILKDIFWFKGYSAFDFLKFALGSASSTGMTPIFTQENLCLTETTFQVPVYIIHGKHDYQVSYAVAQDYFEVIEAPEKAFYTFEHSAHSPNFEETDTFLAIVFSILEKYEKD